MTEPPCDTCLPTLWPENEEAVQVYLQVCNQLIIAPLGGPVDIDLTAVDAAVRRANVEDKDKVFWQVVEISRHFLREDDR